MISDHKSPANPAGNRCDGKNDSVEENETERLLKNVLIKFDLLTYN